MATVGDYFSTAHRMELINPDTMALLNRLNTAMLQNRPQVIDRIAQMSEGAYALAAAASKFEREYEVQIKLMKPAICSAVQMAAQLNALMQPRLDLLRSLAPTVEQFSTLLQQTASLADEAGSVCEEDLSVLSSEEWEETDQAVGEILADPQNWEHTLNHKIEAAKVKHPILSKVIPWALNTILAYYIGTASGAAGAADSAKQREQPPIAAPALTETVQNQPALVIDSVPGYYKIKLRDPETGETEIGWISEQILQNQKETVTDTDTTEESAEIEKAQAEPEPTY